MSASEIASEPSGVSSLLLAAGAALMTVRRGCMSAIGEMPTSCVHSRECGIQRFVSGSLVAQTLHCRRQHMSEAYTGDENAAAHGAADWLCLAAAPTFALMALLTGVLGGNPPDLLCSAAQDASPLSGMIPMYVLMSAFHSGPWLKLISSRRSSARGSIDRRAVRHGDRGAARSPFLLRATAVRNRR
jgi:hypothetical protein